MDIFEALAGYRAYGMPNTMKRKRELQIFQRLLEIGNAWAVLKHQGKQEITASDLAEYLDGEYTENDIGEYLYRRDYEGYAAALRRDPHLYQHGLDYLGAREPRLKEERRNYGDQEIEAIAAPQELLDRAFR